MNQKIYSLKLFRVMSCIGVVLVHYGQRASLNGIFRTITDFGAYGVYMFFIISGFLGISHIPILTPAKNTMLDDLAEYCLFTIVL